MPSRALLLVLGEDALERVLEHGLTERVTQNDFAARSFRAYDKLVQPDLIEAAAMKIDDVAVFGALLRDLRVVLGGLLGESRILVHLLEIRMRTHDFAHFHVRDGSGAYGRGSTDKHHDARTALRSRHLEETCRDRGRRQCTAGGAVRPLRCQGSGCMSSKICSTVNSHSLLGFKNRAVASGGVTPPLSAARRLGYQAQKLLYHGPGVLLVSSKNVGFRNSLIAELVDVYHAPERDNSNKSIVRKQRQTLLNGIFQFVELLLVDARIDGRR